MTTEPEYLKLVASLDRTSAALRDAEPAVPVPAADLRLLVQFAELGAVAVGALKYHDTPEGEDGRRCIEILTDAIGSMTGPVAARFGNREAGFRVSLVVNHFIEDRYSAYSIKKFLDEQGAGG